MYYRLILVAALFGCSEAPEREAPDLDPVSFSCGAPCTVTSQCSDVFSGCRYCYLGKCSSGLPASPKPDAGVEAPKDPSDAAPAQE